MYNLNQSVLRVVTRLANNYKYDVEVERIIISSTSDPQNVTYAFKGGYGAELFGLLSRYLNFSYIILPDPTLTYRFDQSANLSIDMFAASYSLLRANLSIIDPTFVIGSSSVHMFFSRRFEGANQDAVLLPFQGSVWLCLCLLIVTLSTSIGIIAHNLERTSLPDSAFQIFAVSVQKDSAVTFSSLSSRIVVWTTAIASVLLLAAYSGTIVSINAVKKYLLNSWGQVVSSNFDISFDTGFNNGSSIQLATDGLKESPTVQKLYQRMGKSKFQFDSFESSIEQVIKRPFAYIIDEETGFDTIEKLIGYLPCDIAKISFANIRYPWGMFLREGSEYREAINYGILKFHESGLLRLLAQRWLPGAGGTACSSRGTSSVSAVELQNIRSIFFLISFGILVAVCVLVFELRCQRRKTCLSHRTAARGHAFMN